MKVQGERLAVGRAGVAEGAAVGALLHRAVVPRVAGPEQVAPLPAHGSLARDHRRRGQTPVVRARPHLDVLEEEVEPLLAAMVVGEHRRVRHPAGDDEGPSAAEVAGEPVAPVVLRARVGVVPLRGPRA